MNDKKALDEAKIYKITGKNSSELLKTGNSNNIAPRNATFDEDSGLEELRHLENIVKGLSDAAVIKIARSTGLINEGTTESDLTEWLNNDSIDHLKSWMSELGREDFYKAYNEIII